MAPHGERKALAAVEPREQGWAPVRKHEGELKDLGYRVTHHRVLGESLLVLTGSDAPARPFG